MPERQKVYEAAKTLLVMFQDRGAISQDDYYAYLRGTANAEFIFDDNPEALQYLHTLRQRAIELMRLQEARMSADKHAEVSLWFIEQFDVLRSKFRSSMRLHPPSVREQFEQGVARLSDVLKPAKS